MYDSRVVYHRTLSRQILRRFLGRAKRVLEPIQRVRFTRAALRQANIREKEGPSLGKVQVKIPHKHKVPTPWNLRTDLQERLQDKREMPAEEWIMPAASTINPEEREFVLDSGASMHMVSKKDLNKAELETVRKSTNPTLVMTACGEVLAEEEATVYVRELDLLVMVTLLENTPAVLSLGKLCEELGYSYHWTSGQKPHLIKKGKKVHCDSSNHVPFVVPGLSTSSCTSSTSPTSSSQETVTDTEIPATSRSERGLISTWEIVAWINKNWKSKKKWRRGIAEWWVTRCAGLATGVQRLSWLMKVFQNIKMLPVLLMNYLWSREQKWYRVNKTSLLIYRKTGIAISVWGRR